MRRYALGILLGAVAVLLFFLVVRGAMTDFPILLAIIATPAIGAVVVDADPEQPAGAAPRRRLRVHRRDRSGSRVWLLWDFQVGNPDFQYVENRPWLPGLGTRFVVGVDGISLFMVVITALLMPIGLLASEKYVDHRPPRPSPRGSSCSRCRSWGSSSRSTSSRSSCSGSSCSSRCTSSSRDGAASGASTRR